MPRNYLPPYHRGLRVERPSSDNPNQPAELQEVKWHDAGVSPLAGIMNAPPMAPSHAPEQTPLSGDEQTQYRNWLAGNGITDADNPDSHYDYPGFWKEHPDFSRAPGQHLTDEFKQHGHPTFSTESRYSRGPWDGVTWLGEGEKARPIRPPFPSHRQYF